jgi:hypothetical protein
MLTWTFAVACAVLLAGHPASPKPVQEDPAQSEPTSQPAEKPKPSSLRKPSQADILRDLLRPQRPKPIAPETDAGADAGGAATTQPADGTGRQALLLEGAFLVERPGRLVVEEGQPMFVFHADGSTGVRRTLQILPNQLLETMEREAEAGFTEFIISAEVTSYRGDNYLLLRKVLRRVGHGNLGP